MTTTTYSLLESNEPYVAVHNLFVECRKRFNLVLVGRDKEFEEAFVALSSNGHILWEGDAGVGKTVMGETFAKLWDGTYGTLSFTPDMMPSTVSGGHVWNRETNKFEFVPGPIFVNLFFGDEINRASPKTQSALLKPMEQGAVSSFNETIDLPHPFMLIAAQNPLEYEGTYPLPRNQEDRFLMWVTVPRITDHAQRTEIAKRNLNGGIEFEPVLTVPLVEEIRTIRQGVEINDAMYAYINEILDAIETHDDVAVGPGERSMIHISRVAQATAMINENGDVQPQYVTRHILSVLRHKTILTDAAVNREVEVDDVLNEAVSRVPVPRMG